MSIYVLTFTPVENLVEVLLRWRWTCSYSLALKERVMMAQLQILILGAHCFLILFLLLFFLMLYVKMSLKKACERSACFTAYFFIILQCLIVQKWHMIDFINNTNQEYALLFAMVLSIAVLYGVFRYTYGSVIHLLRFQIPSICTLFLLGGFYL